jgi:formate dehydrogenase subunit delta
VNPEVMVHKANQIALFFASYPREEAIAGVANHLRMFWEPRMRRQIVAHVESGGAGLHELVPEAVRRLDEARDYQPIGEA